MSGKHGDYGNVVIDVLPKIKFEIMRKCIFMLRKSWVIFAQFQNYHSSGSIIPVSFKHSKKLHPDKKVITSS